MAGVRLSLWTQHHSLPLSLPRPTTYTAAQCQPVADGEHDEHIPLEHGQGRSNLDAKRSRRRAGSSTRTVRPPLTRDQTSTYGHSASADAASVPLMSNRLFKSGSRARGARRRASGGTSWTARLTCTDARHRCQRPESHTLQRRGVTVLQMRKLWCPAELNSSRPLHHLSAFVYPRRIEPAIWRKITPISIEVADQSKQANLILTGINFVLILEYYRANRPSWQR